MEVSVSFTDEDVSEYAEDYIGYETQIGNVYIPAKGVIIEEPMAIRYEKHPWIEAFELDGIKPEPARREGFGEKSIQGFVLSLGKVYDGVANEYMMFDGESGFDAEGFFRHAADRVIAEAETDSGQFRRFSGFTENMWRLGNEPSYKITLETIIPRLRENEDIWSRFKADITEEFREEIAKLIE